MRAFFFCLGAVLTAQAVLAQSTPVPRVGQCPTGTTTSGNACLPVGGTQVFYNGGGPCPRGWVSSKAYCYRR